MSLTTPASVGVAYELVDILHRRRLVGVGHVVKNVALGSIAYGVGRYAANMGSAFAGPGSEVLATGIVSGIGSMAFERNGFSQGFYTGVTAAALGGATSKGLEQVPGVSWINSFWGSGGGGGSPSV
jgi:hypothetical protein